MMTKNKRKKLYKSIFFTLSYFKALETPITLVQISRHLISKECFIKFSLDEVRHILEVMIKKGVVLKQKGLYILKFEGEPNKKLLAQFIRKEKNAQKKIRIAKKALKVFSGIPYVRAFFICGSVARKNCRADSDIDFLVICKENRVWTVRFFLMFFSFLLNKKTKENASRKNKFCLNHFRSLSNLELEKIMQDIYSAQDYSGMINIFSVENTEEFFLKANKQWMKKMISDPAENKPPIFRYSKLNNTVRKTLEAVLNNKAGEIFEKILKKAQIAKIQRSRKKVKNPNNRIEATDNVVMFHLSPRSPQIMEKFQGVIEKKIREMDNKVQIAN